jgi:ketosteroid isomerase-like protein
VGRPAYYGNTSGSTPDVAAVQAVYDAFARRDLEGALRHIAQECELYLEGTAEAVGRTEPYRGHEGMREYFADVERVWEELTLHAEDIRAVPGSVLVMGHVSGVRDGRAMRRAAVWTWRLRDGKAVYVRATGVG